MLRDKLEPNYHSENHQNPVVREFLKEDKVDSLLNERLNTFESDRDIHDLKLNSLQMNE